MTMGDGWQPIGTFNATFNGNGYTISNLMINRSDTNNVGLFSRTASSARITNLGLLNVAITGQNEVGSLVGRNDGGSIANSYATGSVAEAGDNVGGLVGLNDSGSITNSYATVSVLRSGSRLGGLVGTNRARITNSYATGRVSGTQGIGSLVGFNTGGNALIEDSYATGRVSWSRFNAIGGLVGQNDSTINDSYWLREDATNRRGINVSRSTLRTTMELQEPTTATGIYADWSPADWDFGSSIQYPILKAAGSDTLLPNQGVGLRSLQTAIVGAELIPTFGGATTRHTFFVPFGTSRIDLTLTAYNPVATIALIKQGESPVTDYFAGKGSRGTASVPIATTPVLSITVSEPNLDPIVYRVVVTTLPLCTVSLNIPDDNDGVEQVLDIDKDDDGLIEICDVEGLDAMRHVLDGSGYKTTDSAMVAAITEGCPSGDCNGYELARSLDFMDDNSYRTTANKVTYTVSNYNDSSDTGWQPVGDNTNAFAAIFNGNGHTISNLMINRGSSSNIGLFGVASGGRIANLGLLDVDVRGENFVGGLAGISLSRITNSYATGSVIGIGSEASEFANVGGLVGQNQSTITNSYATASVEGFRRNVGGLVGRNDGTIVGSYAAGSVTGSDDNVGGLAGENNNRIINSYAIGEVTGSGATVGGLVGSTTGTATITGSYWLSSSASSGGDGVPANTSRTALQLASPTTTAITYTDWDPNVWDFGSPFQYPALKYAGDDCVTTPVVSDAGPPVCGTTLLNQQVNLTGLLPLCTASLIGTYTDSDGVDLDQFDDIDKDDDGLIEICDVEGLNEIRHQLDGSGYKASADAMKITMGCPTSCTGFELTRSLDFMDDASYRNTANKATYTVSDYDDSDDNGWDPVGILAAPFNAKFDGNGYTISNLMINRDGSGRIGLFGVTSSDAEITNLGLLDVNITGRNNVGGLVGQNQSAITNSYATGLVLGTSSNVGGLVGNNFAATITNSYAMVSVSGLSRSIGGLVGSNSGEITNSYATGTVSGSNSTKGGLAGFNDGTITNSYAAGKVNGSGITVGGLAGSNSRTIIDSYWLSRSASSGGNNVATDTEKTTMQLQEPTTATDIYADWKTADWDFGTSRQFPILKYPPNGNLISNLIGNLIPNQGIGLRSLQTSTTGAELIPPLGGATTRHTIAHTIIIPPGTSGIDLTLTAYNPTAKIEVVKEGEPSTDYFAGKDGRGSASVPIAINPVLIITVREPDLEPIVYRLVVATLSPCTVSLNTPDDNDGVNQALDIDKDGDGLIEICDLEGLDEMRHQLDGSGYNATDGGIAITTGCPSGDGCTGYELTKSLDFMAASSYRLGDINSAWTSGAGWQPIGLSSSNPFTGTFDGNGHTISNLMIGRSGENNIGLFGGAANKIANLGLLDVDISGQDAVGGLVGDNSTTITNSYVTGEVKGRSQVGGLVGDNSGAIMNSYATASVEGTGANVGGLVGRNNATIMSSYAIGSVSGSTTNRGGLVGNNQSAGSIMNSYATGRVIDSGATVGGLVGRNDGGTITGSYWLRSSANSNGRGDTTSTPTTAGVLISPTAPTTTTYAGWSTSNWDFGNDEQFPALKYAADCDIEPSDKSDTRQPICEEKLPNQQVELQNQFLPPCTADLIGDDRYTDNDRVFQALDVDKDDNGLIEICDLEGLFEMRYQLDGMSYTTTGADAVRIPDGCRRNGGCIGYELTRDLDFNDPNSYRSGSINPAWTDTNRAGWDPIGVSTSTFNAFSAIFDGNGYTIANLLINRPTDGGVGFFRGITGRINDIRLADVRVTGATNIAGLAGVSLGTINNAYVSGTISGTADNVGGLVGYNRAPITNSYAIADVSGNNTVGGLVGYNRAPITNSYAIADVSGNDSIGGLVGENQEGSAMIRNSFALATVRGVQFVGGLVGFLDDGSIFNGYARGLVFADND